MAPRVIVPVRRIPAGRLGLETGMTVVRVEQVKLKRAYFITVTLDSGRGKHRLQSVERTRILEGLPQGTRGWGLPQQV